MTGIDDRLTRIKTKSVPASLFAHARSYIRLGIFSSQSKQFLVLFLGTDGSGKTTLIRHLKSNPTFECTSMYFAEKEWHLPLMGKIFAYIPTKNLLSKALWLLYCYLLLPLELLKRVFALKKCKKTVVLIDRYPGYVFLGNAILRSIYKIVLPKPNIVFLLKGNAEIISKRKNEANAEQTMKGTEKFRKVAKVLTNDQHIIEIDTTANSLEECVKILLDTICGDPTYQQQFSEPPC